MTTENAANMIITKKQTAKNRRKNNMENAPRRQPAPNRSGIVPQNGNNTAFKCQSSTGTGMAPGPFQRTKARMHYDN